MGPSRGVFIGLTYNFGGKREEPAFDDLPQMPGGRKKYYN